MTTPIDLGLIQARDVAQVRAQARGEAEHVQDKPLAIVLIWQTYFRLMARLALKSGNPDENLEEMLAIHAASARLELKLLREAGL